MVSLSDVKRWNVGQIDEIFRTVQQRLQVLIHSGDDYGKVFPVEGWAGAAADNAGSAHKALMSRVEKMVAGASIVNKSIGQAADAITGVQRAIANAEELARKYGYQITGTGGLVDPSQDMSYRQMCIPKTGSVLSCSSPTISVRRCGPQMISTTT